MTPYLQPLLVSGVFVLISIAAGRARREVTARGDVYRYPAFTRYLMGLLGAVLGTGLSARVLLGPPDGPEPLLVPLLFCTGAAACAAAAIYFLRYRVIVGEGVLAFGAFRLRSVALSDIIDLDATPGSKSYLYVYLRDGRRVHFTNMLGDIASLASTLGARLPADRQPCPRRLRDRRDRMLYLWILLGSMLAMGAGAYYWVHR